jgi:sigma-B regulation protein RsbU (phosphoserine phosphatase)
MRSCNPLTEKSRGRRKVGIRSKAALTSATFVQELENLGDELCGALEPQAVTDSLTSRLVERYGAAFSGVWSLKEDGASLELVSRVGKPGLVEELAKAPASETILGRAVASRLPQTLAKADGEQDKLARWAKQHRLRFLAAYPLLDDSKVQGVLLVACAKLPQKPLLALFRLHARLASVALRDAELLSSSQRTLSKLSFLIEATKALNSTLDLSELLGRILDVAKNQVEAERGTLFLLDENTNEIWSLIAHGLEKQEIRLPLGKGIAGHVAQTGEIVLIPDAYADPRFNPDVDKRTGYRTRSILCLPIRNKAGKIIATLQLLNKKQGVFTQEDADALLTLSGHMALALENAQLHQELLEKERMEKELALARGIQRSLLPDTAPLVEGFDIAVLNEPCYAVGGDYYDFLTLGPHTLLVVIADVEGKGVSSALVMSNLQATLRALVLHLHSLDEIAESLNRMILNDTRSQKYLSIFMGLIDVRRKGLHYINCGHVPPVIIRPSQAPIPLTDGGMVIGLFENARYERGHTRLQGGDVLILCTDGITESMDPQHEEYGADRLIHCVQGVADHKAGEIVSFVSTDVARFSRHGTHLDDKVMIVIKVV